MGDQKRKSIKDLSSREQRKREKNGGHHKDTKENEIKYHY